MEFSNRAMALNYLRSYQQASLIPSLNALESHLDQKYPGFLDVWGRAVRNLRSDYVKDALTKLARRNGMAYPSRPDLNQITLDVPTGSIGSATKAAASETVKAVGDGVGEVFDAAKFWGKLAVPLVILGGAAYFLVVSGGGVSGMKTAFSKLKGRSGASG